MPTTQGIFVGSGCCEIIQATSFSSGLCAPWRRKREEMVGAPWYQIRQTTPLQQTTLFERVTGFIDQRTHGRGHKRCTGTNRCNARNSYLRPQESCRKTIASACDSLKPGGRLATGLFCFGVQPQRGGDFLPCSRGWLTHHAAQQYACRKTFTCGLYFVRRRC
jgi:hypothetical protein